jgi:hypothetical protein
MKISVISFRRWVIGKYLVYAKMMPENIGNRLENRLLSRNTRTQIDMNSESEYTGLHIPTGMRIVFCATPLPLNPKQDEGAWPTY